jgi:hypothetical protein
MSNQLNSHLFKIYIFPKSKYVIHWENEIENFLQDITDKTWGKKDNRFEEEDYFKWLFLRYFHDTPTGERQNIKMRYKSIFLKYPDEQPRENWSDIVFITNVKDFINSYAQCLKKVK